jgi:hypothetical protein
MWSCAGIGTAARALQGRRRSPQSDSLPPRGRPNQTTNPTATSNGTAAKGDARLHGQRADVRCAGPLRKQRLAERELSNRPAAGAPVSARCARTTPRSAHTPPHERRRASESCETCVPRARRARNTWNLRGTLNRAVRASWEMGLPEAARESRQVALGRRVGPVGESRAGRRWRGPRADRLPERRSDASERTAVRRRARGQVTESPVCVRSGPGALKLLLTRSDTPRGHGYR